MCSVVLWPLENMKDATSTLTNLNFVNTKLIHFKVTPLIDLQHFTAISPFNKLTATQTVYTVP